MDITIVKFAFSTTPPEIARDLVSRCAARIIICSANQQTVDIGLMHEAAKKAGRLGFIYHYAIKNGTEDGAVFYPRPTLYQNDLPYNNANRTSVINNSIAICLAGKKGAPITQKQKESLVKLILLVMDQEKMGYGALSFLHELTKSSAEIPEWKEIKAIVKEQLASMGSLKALIMEDPNGMVKSLGEFDQVITTKRKTTLKELSDMLGIPIDALRSSNKLADENNIPPNQPICIPKSPFSATVKGAQQSSVAGTLKKLASEVVNTKIVEKNDYKAAKASQTQRDIYNVDQLTTLFGGKKAPTWQADYNLPGYHNALLQILDSGTKKIIETINFLVSPSSFNDSRTNSQQMNKTNGGWFIMRTGKMPGQISLSGYMLDIKTQLERHDFIAYYKKYIEDQKNSNLEYVNKYQTRIVIEGREYNGFISGLTFTKSANQQLLYQYNLQMTVMTEKMIYLSSWAVKPLNEVLANIKSYNSLNVVTIANSKTLPKTLYNKLNPPSNNMPTVKP